MRKLNLVLFTAIIFIGLGLTTKVEADLTTDESITEFEKGEKNLTMLWYSKETIRSANPNTGRTWYESDMLEILGKVDVLIVPVDLEPRLFSLYLKFLSYLEDFNTQHESNIRVLWRLRPGSGFRRETRPADKEAIRKITSLIPIPGEDSPKVRFIDALRYSSVTFGFQTITGEPGAFFDLDDPKAWKDFKQDYIDFSGLQFKFPGDRDAQDIYWYNLWRTKKASSALITWMKAMQDIDDNVEETIALAATPTMIVNAQEQKHIFDIKTMASSASLAHIADMWHWGIDRYKGSSDFFGNILDGELMRLRLAFAADAIKDISGIPVSTIVQAHVHSNGDLNNPPVPEAIEEQYLSIVPFVDYNGLYCDDMPGKPVFLPHKTGHNAPQRWAKAMELFDIAHNTPKYHENHKAGLLIPLNSYRADYRRYMVMIWLLLRKAGYDVHIYDAQRLSNYTDIKEKILFLVASQQYPQKTIEALEEWVRKGGILVTDPLAAICVNENGQRQSNNIPNLVGLASGLSVLNWSNTITMEITADHPMLPYKTGDKLDGEWRSVALPDAQFVSAQILARLEDGRPAMSLRHYNLGKIIYLGIYPKLTPDFQNLFAGFCQHAYENQKLKGVYAVIGFNKSPQQATLDNPYVDGLVIRTYWKDINPSPDIYDWNYLDTQFKDAESKNKKVHLIISPGFHSPEWVLKSVPTVKFKVPYGPGKGELKDFPIPWNDDYLASWFNFVNKVAQRYAQHPALGYISATGPNSHNGEMSLPKEGVDENGNITWIDVVDGDSRREKISKLREHLLNAWAKTFEAYNKAFLGKTRFTLALVPNAFPVQVNEYFHQSYKKDIVEQAAARFPLTFGLQSNGLDGRRQGFAWNWNFIGSYSGIILTGFQTNNPTKLYSGNGDEAEILRQTVKNGLDRKVNFIEIYEKDILDPAKEEVIRYAHE